MRGLNRSLPLAFVVAICGAACSQSKSANPLSPELAGPIAGVTITPPTPVSPAAGAQVASDQQPIDLVVANGDTNGVRPLKYDLEIASDAAFGTKVFSQTGIAPGSDGKTTYRMPQSLSADFTYYWRAKAEDGANTSDYSSASSFRVFTPVVIGTPILVAPADGSTVSTPRPTLTVTDVTRSGPVGSMQYDFEAATDAAFSARVATVAVPESSGQTSFTPTSDLPASTRVYWRARAFDPTHVGPYSNIQSFVTPAVIQPQPQPQPPPPPPGGGGGGSDAIDASQASFFDNPQDLGSWAVTTKITSVTFTNAAFLVDFDKRQGPGKWPSSPFGDGSIQYTLGMCLNIGNHWDCSAAIQFWDGRDLEASGNPFSVAQDWFYDGRWGPLAGHGPQTGDTVGLFVAQGNLRDSGTSTLRERSNIVLVKWMTSYSGN